MKAFTIAAANLLAVSALLWAPPSIAQSDITLPERFSSCADFPGNTAENKNYKNCSSGTDIDEYGSIFVQYLPTPPDAANLSGAMRTSFLRALRGLFVGKTDSVVVVATIMLRRDGAAAPILLDKIPLASYTKKSGTGIAFDQSITGISSRVGPKYRLGGDARIEVTIEAIRNKGSNVQIVSRIAQIRDLLTGVGLVPMPSEKLNAAISQAKALDATLSTMFGSGLRLTQPIIMSYDENSLMAASRRIELQDSLLPVGNLFVGLDRHPSVLVDNAKVAEDGSWSFGTPDYSAGVTNRILSRYLMNMTLKERVEQKFSPQDFAELSGDDPTKFNAACGRLVNVLASVDLNLGAADQMLAFWAYTARNGNLRKYAIRNQQCFSDLERSDSFRRYNLPLPPRPSIPLTAEQKQVMESARNASTKASQARELALQSAQKGAGAAADARKTPKPVNFDILPWPGLYQYAGAKPMGNDAASGEALVGEMLFLAPPMKGTVYSGAFALDVTRLTPAGYGIITYSSAQPDFPKDFAGQFANGAPEGFGVMTWRDGGMYRGALIKGAPEGFGMMTFADGTVAIARFSGGSPEGPGLRQTGNTTQPGTWIAGEFRPSDAE